MNFLNARIEWRGIALLALYAVGYLLARPISVDQWYLPAGLRVAALILVPKRYWLYLIAGECVAILYLRIPRIAEYGVVFVALSSITIMPLAAAIVSLTLRLIPKNPGRQFVVMASLVAAATTSANLTLTHVLMRKVEATEWSNSLLIMLGAFLGMITLALPAMLWRDRLSVTPFPRRLRFDGAAAAAFVLALCVIAKSLPLNATHEMVITRMLMLAPAVFLTFSHGYRGAALGAICATVGIGITIKRSQIDGTTDYAALAPQFLLAIASLVLLEAGSAISRLYTKAKASNAALHEAMDIARGSFIHSERDLLRRMEQLKEVSDAITFSFHSSVAWLREQGHHAIALELQNRGVQQSRLVREKLSLVYPVEIDNFGLFRALTSSELARSWGTYAEIRQRLKGDDGQLSLDLQLMTYRVVCDLLAVLIATEHKYLIVHARTGVRAGKAGVYVRISVPTGRFKATMAAITNLDVTGRVRASGGRLRKGGGHIGLWMHEPALTAESGHRAEASSTAQVTAPAST